MFFPLASYFAINMTGDYLLSGEHQVMVLMSWPILFFLLLKRPYSWTEGCVLFFTLTVFCASYETAVVPIGIFFILTLVRLWYFKGESQKIILLICVLLLAFGAYLSATYIITPRSLVQKGSFVDAILRNLKLMELVYFVPFLLVFFIGWLVPTTRGWVKNFIYGAGFTIVMMYAYERLTTDYAITSYGSFSSRTLSLLLLPGMLLGATLVYYGKFENTKFGARVFGLSCLVMLAFNLYDLRYWVSVKAEFVKAQEVENMFFANR